MNLPREHKKQEFLVIHPLDDTPEEKINVDAAGAMNMTLGVRIILGVLQLYLGMMTIMVLYHVFRLAVHSG